MSAPSSWQLHPRLAADTHLIAQWPLSDLRLMDDARFPWLILVPRIAEAAEVIDLAEADQLQLALETRRAARLMQAVFAPDKLNIAAIGNVVRQLHVHVVARYATDAAWPAPVWGHGDAQRYADAARSERLGVLALANPD